MVAVREKDKSVVVGLDPLDGQDDGITYAEIRWSFLLITHRGFRMKGPPLRLKKRDLTYPSNPEIPPKSGEDEL